MAISLKCPSCQTSLTSNPPGSSATNRVLPSEIDQSQILVCYTNEGGVQDSIDILPHITEEAYLDANPSARPARAFMIMCSEGDVGGIIELLQTAREDFDEDEAGAMSPSNILRYQDPLGNVAMKTGLHLAIEREQQEVVWLLLWLASDLPERQFPDEAVHAAASMNARRPDMSRETDIRSLRDAQGQTAEDVATAQGGVWTAFLHSGILTK